MNEIHVPELDFNLLRLFHYIYGARSVSVAAEQLGMTQSAASHALHRLRAILGDELFVRVGTRLMPTAKAERLYEPISAIMDTITREVLTEVVFEPREARREFVLAMTDMAEFVFLPPIHEWLQRVAPGCTIRSRRVPDDSLVEELDSNRIELVIGNMPTPPDHLYQQNLFTHDYVVVAWRNHPRLSSPSITWADYARESHIVVASGSDQHLVDRTLVPRGVKRRIALTVGGFLPTPWIIRGTELIATVPERLGTYFAESADLRPFELPDPAERYSLQCTWHARWHNDPGHRWLRESIYKLMHDYPSVNVVS
jgi:DNA-binding transcriptional LysR family regulator